MNETKKDPTCQERVREHFINRIGDLHKLWATYCEGPEKYLDDLGNMYEYGLCFDYVCPGTFVDQKRGYFRYQLSWGGPSDEFRIYTGPGFEVDRIEYWFLDWYDGAHITLHGEQLELMEEIFQQFFVNSETAQAQYEKAIEGE